MKKVTLKDIARELGVTVGTVSHALNGLDDISEDTKKRVLDTAKALGYISNSSAVSLRSGKTKTIAIIVPDISNPHISYQIKLIEDRLKASGYSVIIFNTNENEGEEYQAIVTSLGKNVDGILFCPCQSSKENVDFLMRAATPFILIGRYFSDIDTDYVAADDFQGGYLAGKYLIEKGKSSPVYLGAYRYIEASEKRFLGLCAAFSEEGIELPQDRFIEISPCLGVSEEIIEKLDAMEEADSLLSFSDLIAFEIMSALKNTSLTVVGFDGIAGHLKLPIRSVSIVMDGDGWANSAADFILKKINGEEISCRKVIPVSLKEFNM